MHDDDRPVGRILTRRELVALFGAAAAASFAHSASAQSGTGQPSTIVPSCVVHPQQTEGPFFVDEKLLRSDVRADSRTGVVSAGSPLELGLTIAQVSAAGACAPLAGAQVDIWQCDALGRYSDVNDRRNSTNGQTFLRGHQVTDAKGTCSSRRSIPVGIRVAPCTSTSRCVLWRARRRRTSSPRSFTSTNV